MTVLARDVVRDILSANPKKAMTESSLTPAAVMLLLYPKDGADCILLNKRTYEVEHHKGEISFPGGQRDITDASLLDTALRETYEEMGIQPHHVEVLGELDDVHTTSHFLVTTHVGAIPHPYTFTPSKAEVAAVLEVPVVDLMDNNNLREEVKIIDNKQIPSYAYAFEGDLIYGATARILTRFLDLLEAVPDKEALWKI